MRSKVGKKERLRDRLYISEDMNDVKSEVHTPDEMDTTPGHGASGLFMMRLVSPTNPPGNPTLDAFTDLHSYNNSSPRKRKQRITKPYAFMEEQEKDLAEWYRDNDILYNRRHPEFKLTEKKKRLLTEKGQTYEPKCSYEQLKLWMDNMRTQFGRVTNQSSRSGKGTIHGLSHRDLWIKESFAFLDPHIVRIPSRSSAKFPKIPDTHTQVLELSSGIIKVEEEDEEDTRATSIGTDYTVGDTSKGPVHEMPEVLSNDNNQELDTMAKFISCMNNLDEIRKAMSLISAPLKAQTQHEEQVYSYVNYLRTQLVKIPENRWINFNIDMMNLVQSYIQMDAAPKSS